MRAKGQGMADKSTLGTIGPYKIQELLGSGSYAHTYLATDADANPLALKWQKENPPPGADKRFENEIWALKTIDHSAVPRYVDDGNEAGRPFIALDYARGEPLRKTIDRNIASETFMAGVDVVGVARSILEGLLYMHAIPLMHRDLKPANLIVSPNGDKAKIIDFGLCKSIHAPNQDETFWPTAASKYSHPNKMDKPSAAEPCHDVFALGVVCYEMLTNRTPWSVKLDDYRGLVEHMRSFKPPRVSDINKAISDELSSLVMDMISIEEFKIPSVSKSLDRLKHIAAAQTAPLSDRLIRNFELLHLSRVVLDPLHGDVQVSEFEIKSMSTAEMQRLRRVKQLGFTNLVYPGADHSRFSHMIGTMHVAEKILRSIEIREGITFDPVERQAVRLYALLHDVSHAPFGHTIEDELSLLSRHDKNLPRLQRIFLHDSSELSAHLETEEWGRVIKKLLTNDPIEANHWIKDFIESPVGPDILDYLDRDALFCGLGQRVDTAIFRRFRLVTSPVRLERRMVVQLFGSHGPRADIDFGLESLLRDRYAMFLKVYTHPIKLAAGAMLGKALYEALASDPPSIREEDIEQMGDEELLLTLAAGSSETGRVLARRLLDRKLYQAVYRTRALPGEATEPKYFGRLEAYRSRGLLDPAGRRSFEEAIARDTSINAGDIILYFPRSAPGAQKVSHAVERELGKVAIKDDADDTHVAIYNHHLELWNIYVFVSPDLSRSTREAVAIAVQEQIGLVNENDKELRDIVSSRRV
jgi:uncharacterized protein